MELYEYNCAECDAQLKKGDSFCPKCGIKLKWPEEEKPVSKRANRMESSDELGVNPAAVDRLTDSSIGCAIAILFCCSFGNIIAPIILVHRSDMKKWLLGLRWQNGARSFSPDIIVDKARSIKNASIWAMVLTIIFTLIEVVCFAFAASYAKNSESGAMAFWAFMSAVLGATGIICSGNLMSKAERVIESSTLK